MQKTKWDSPKRFTILPSSLQELETETIGGKRHYITPLGIRLPSVTTVLDSHYGWKWKKWRESVGEEEAKRITTAAARRGTKLHTMCENYLLGKEMDKIMPDAMERFNGIRPIIDKYIDVIHGVELSLYSEKIKIAGRTDCIADFDGCLSVIDFKTSTRYKSKEDVENYFIQATAYAIMYGEMTRFTPKHVALIFATDEGDYYYIHEEIEGVWVRKLSSIIKEYYDKQNNGIY